jgi:hypothetical protein
MEYRTLGRSGLRISRLSLGAMTFGAGSGIWGQIAGLDRAQAARLIAVAAEQGINFIDTADAYSQGKSEEVVGQVLSDLGLDETRMLVATKVRLRTGPGPNEVGLGRSHITTLDVRQLAILERYGERRTLKAYDILHFEGDRHIAMFAILSGTIQATRASVQGIAAIFERIRRVC